MLRIAATVAALVAFPTASFAARGDGTPPAPTVAKLVACDLVSSDRSATFLARIDAVPGAQKLAIRFQLFERFGSAGDWQKLDVPALRVWHVSQPGVQHFTWRQTVDNLRIGAAYKARVQYRWLGPSGAVLATDSHDTTACHGPLPNLVVGDLTVSQGPTADTRSYRVAVENLGKADADGVDVSLAVDNAMLDTLTIGHLAAGEARFATFTGPACQTGILVQADPANTIGETLESDNSQLFGCS